jgi:hypothetical protein
MAQGNGQLPQCALDEGALTAAAGVLCVGKAPCHRGLYYFPIDCCHLCSVLLSDSLTLSTLRGGAQARPGALRRRLAHASIALVDQGDEVVVGGAEPLVVRPLPSLHGARRGPILRR